MVERPIMRLNSTLVNASLLDFPFAVVNLRHE
jgi:hypothetical protein